MIDQNYNGYYNYNGYAPQQVQKAQSTLTKEEIEKLTKSTARFSLNITNEERLRGICNHRTAEGTLDCLVPDDVTGLTKCAICGYTFRQVDPSMTADEIKEVINQVVDLLQSTKLLFLDMPAESAREYFQIIPLLEKLPALFELAAKNFSKHEIGNGWNTQSNNINSVNMFQNLWNTFGGGAMGQPMGAGFQQPNMYQQQPMMGQPANMYGQPMGNPMYGAAPQSNGFMYTNPQPGYQPANPGFAYNPGGVTPATPTVAPANVVATQDAVEVKPGEDTVVQTVKA